MRNDKIMELEKRLADSDRQISLNNAYKEFLLSGTNANSQNISALEEKIKSLVSEKESIIKEIRELNKNDLKNPIKAYPLTAMSIIISLMLGLLILNPSFIGMVIGPQSESYTQTINILANESDEYTLILGPNGTLTSARISGSITSDRNVKVYFDDKLMMDSDLLNNENEGITGITGLAISTSIDEKINDTETSETSTHTNEMINDAENILNESTENVIDIVINKNIIKDNATITTTTTGIDTKINETIQHMPQESNENITINENITSENDAAENNHATANNITVTDNNTQITDENITLKDIISEDNIAEIKNITLGTEQNITIDNVPIDNLTAIENKIINETLNDTITIINTTDITSLGFVNITNTAIENDTNMTNLNITKDESKSIFEYVCVETCLLDINNTNHTLRIVFESLESEGIILIENISYTVIPGIIENSSIPTPNMTYENTQQGIAEIGKPVIWTKTINLEKAPKDYKIKLPKNSININAETIDEMRIAENTTNKKTEKQKRKLAKNEITAIENDDGIEIRLTKNVSILEIKYATEAPEVNEKIINKYRKEVTISSETHYSEIMTYTNITEAKQNTIHLYWLVNGTKIETTITDYTDTDGNGLIDRIEWITPHLSNETFIIEIIVLNVQSYPTVGGNWTVMFNTTGMADLTIRTIDGTTWSNENNDHDLHFLELQCGEEQIDYSWINDTVFYANYTCDNITSYETSSVWTTGAHHLEFRYGELYAWANNYAINTTTQGEFNNGTYNHTLYNTTLSAVELITNDSEQELPNNKISDGWIDMTGNVLLMHLNENISEINETTSLGNKIVGLWHMNNNQSTDSSGKGNDGVMKNGLDCNNDHGKFKQGCTFDGINDYMNISHSVSLDFQYKDNFTILVWVKTVEAAQAGIWNNIIAKEDNIAVRQGWNIQAHESTESRWAFNIFTGIQTYTVYGTNDIADGKWHMLVGMRNGTNITVYEDGVLANMGYVPDMTVSKTIPLVIGTDSSYSTTHNFNGSIDEVAIWNRSLSAAEIAELYAKGNQTIKDDSGSNNNGNATNGIIGGSGKLNTGIEFDGIDDYINVSNTSLTHIINGTVSAWIKTANPGTSYRGIVTKNGAWGMYLNDGVFGIYDMAGTAWRSSGINLSDGDWHHVVANFKNGTAGATLLYVDGNLKISTTSTILNNNNHVYIGSSINMQWFNGSIDEVGIWNRSLSEAEINDLYNRQKGQFIDRGIYTSKVFDANHTAKWTNISWNQNFVQGELPDNKFDEHAIKQYGANMSDNILLMHLNENITEINETTGFGTQLVGLWHMNNNQTTDNSGKGNNGVKQGGLDCNNNIGKFRQGCTFDGIDDSINITYSGSLDINGSEFSFSAWFYPTENVVNMGNDWAPILAMGWPGDLPSVQKFHFSRTGATDDGRMSFVLFNESDNYTLLNTSTIFTANKWYHVVGTYNGSIMKIYINNVLENSTNFSGNINNANTNLYIGRARPTIEFFNGSIDEVAIWNRTLNASEIAELYAMGNQTIKDYSGSDNNGNATNGIISGNGKLSTGIEFDGIDDYINVSTPASSTNIINGTISAWIKTANAGSSYRGIVVKTNAYSMFLKDNIFGIFDWGTTNFRSSGVSLNDGQWHHVAVNFKNATTDGTMLYVDGILKNTTIMTILNNNYNLYIGSNDIVQFFNGSIDEVAVWNRSLSAEEILNIYKRGALRLNISVKDCDDPSCSGEDTWDMTCTNATYCDISSLTSSRYFQYHAFLKGDGSYTPELSEVTMEYDDGTNPLLIVQSPINGTFYNTTNISLNYTATDEYGISRCWFKNSTGANVTISGCTNTTFNGIQGYQNITVYTNDTSNLINSTTIYFTIDTIKPAAILQSPINATIYNTTNISLNYTVTDINLDKCWYTNSTGQNIILTNCQNTTFIGVLGYQNIIVYANDSAGNINSTTIFFQTNTAPNITLITLNATSQYNQTTDNLTIWLTATDADNDPIKNITNWYKNQKSITLLNMPFEGGSNSTWTKDYSGYANNATISGATWNNTGGYDGRGAYEFDGSSDVINLGDLDIYDEFTISTWINPKTLPSGGYMDILTKTDGNSDCNYYLETYDNEIDFGFFQSGGYRNHQTNNVNLVSDNWYHVAVNYDDINQRVIIYVNGVLKLNESETYYLAQNNQDTLIGMGYDGEDFNGSIDEVMIYNLSLSPEQILAIYQNKTNTIVSQELSIGDNWSVCVTPNDGYNDGTMNCSNNITILTVPDETDCGILSSANTVYNLTSNVTSISTCFNITADNVTLDCAGYTINYSTAGILGYGVYANGRTNITIKNCVIFEGNASTDDKEAVYLVNTNNATIFNNIITVIGNLSKGIHAEAVLDSNADMNNITVNGHNGRGVYITWSSNNNITNNDINTTGEDDGIGGGIKMDYESSNNHIIANTITTSGGNTAGISLQGDSNNNQLANMDIIVTGNSASGINLFDSNNNNLTNITIRSYGVGFTLFYDSNNNSLTNMNILPFGDYTSAFDIDDGAYNFTIKDSILNASGTESVQELYIHSSVTGGIFNFTNITRSDGSKINITWEAGANGTLLMNWYLDVNVTNSTNDALENANITIYNNTQGALFNGLTAATGFITRQTVQEYTQNATGTYYSTPLNITATHPSYRTDYNDTVNLTNNLQVNMVLASEIAGEDGCGILSSANTVYNLTSNVTSISTCFNITADNVTLDCAGHTINYSTADILGYGVYADSRTNITIKNCVVFEGNSTTDYKHAVYYLNTHNSYLLNSTINTIGPNSQGIRFEESDNDTISNNIIKTINSQGYGVYLLLGSNNSISYNNITTTGAWGYGIMMHSLCSNNIIQYNNISATNFGSFSLYLYTGGEGTEPRYNTFSNNDLVGGISLERANFNNFTSSTINTSGNSEVRGVMLWTQTKGNIFNGLNIYTYDPNAYAFESYNGNHNITVMNSLLNAVGTNANDIYITNATTDGIFNFTNVTRSDGSPINISWQSGANGTLLMNWYLDVNVTNSTNDALENANITIYNNTQGALFNGLTAATGLISRQTVREYMQNATGTYYSTPLNVTASKTGYYGNYNDTVNLTNSLQVNLILESDTTPPSINFTTPTPDNDTTQNNDYAYINVSTSDANEHSAFIDWNRSLVGWWNFENVLSNGTVYDNSTHNNNGLMSGFSTNTTVNGIRGDALEFDGENDHISVPYSSSLNPVNAITVSAWIKTTAQNRSDIVQRFLPASPWQGYALVMNPAYDCGIDGQIGFWVGDDVGRYLCSLSEIDDGQWHFISGTYDGTIVRVYIDGVEEANGARTNGLNEQTQNMIIGNYSEFRFNGSIDEVMIFSRALTPQEINASYNAGSHRLYNNFTNLTYGTYDYKAYAIDSAGNINNTETRTLIIGSGNVPNITYVSVIPPVGLVENNSVSVFVNFTVEHLDGTIYLNDSSAKAVFNKTGEASRENVSCARTANTSTIANYSCDVKMWYFDASGRWDVNVSISDTNGAYNQNITTNFTVQSLTSGLLSGQAFFSFENINIGASNTQSSNKITILNIGNNNFTLNVTAKNLNGTTRPWEYLAPLNFTMQNTTLGCDIGTRLSHNTGVIITGSNVLRGNNSASINNGTSYLAICLEEITYGATVQNYSTGASGNWSINYQ